MYFPPPRRTSFLLLTHVILTLLVAACSSAQARTVTEERPLRYVAIGASDAVGIGAGHPETEGWVSLLYAQLPRGSSLLNLGISGSLLSQALAQQLPVAVEVRPDLVTVWMVTNDFNARVPLERYVGDLDLLLRELSATGATVLVGNLPDLTLLPRYSGTNPAVVRQEIQFWNAAIHETVARHNAILVDLYAAWPELVRHPEYISDDGFHPSSQGYERLAALFYAALQRSGLQARGGNG